MGEDSRTIDNLAALAVISQAMGDEHQAMSYVSEVLNWIEQHGLAGIEFPVQVHLACYQVLDAQSTRAPWLRERALHALGLGYELVQTRANGITDPELRKMYLNNTPFNRKLMDAWRAERQYFED